MNAWLESGRSDTFVGVRPHDVVFRSSTGTNALVLGNGVNSQALAAMYVTSNCIGIHRLPNASAMIALDIGGQVACRSNMIWCDPNASAANVLSGCNATMVSASGVILNDGTRDTVSIDRLGSIKTSGSVEATQATFGDPTQQTTGASMTVHGRARFGEGVCLLVGGDADVSASASMSFNKVSGLMCFGKLATLGPRGLSVNGSIASSGHMFAPAYKLLSDSRLKTDVVPTDSVQDLASILALDVKRYRLLDNGSGREAGPQVGVLAHELSAVLPDAVSYVSDYLPDVMEQGCTSKCLDDTGELWLTFAHGSIGAGRFAMGDTLRVKLGCVVLPAIVSGVEIPSRRIRLLGLAHGRVALASAPDGTDVFIYGHLRHDIMAVDTSQILFRLVSAVQQLHAQVKELTHVH